MDAFAIAKAQREGAPITCATCVYYHEGNGSCGKTECGGPGMGRDFPLYEGPIPREKLVERCLVCGSNEIAYHVVMGGDKTKFSLCKKHRKVYDQVGAAPGRLKLPVKTIAIP